MKIFVLLAALATLSYARDHNEYMAALKDKDANLYIATEVTLKYLEKEVLTKIDSIANRLYLLDNCVLCNSRTSGSTTKIEATQSAELNSFLQTLTVMLKNANAGSIDNNQKSVAVDGSFKKIIDELQVFLNNQKKENGQGQKTHSTSSNTEFVFPVNFEAYIPSYSAPTAPKIVYTQEGTRGGYTFPQQPNAPVTITNVPNTVVPSQPANAYQTQPTAGYPTAPVAQGYPVSGK